MAQESCAGAYSKPTIWSAAFPNTPESLFWSSSPYAYYPGSAWSVSFNYGYGGYNYESNDYPVRLVRGGQ